MYVVEGCGRRASRTPRPLAALNMRGDADPPGAQSCRRHASLPYRRTLGVPCNGVDDRPCATAWRLDGDEIAGLGFGRESAQVHVVKHALAQRSPGDTSCRVGMKPGRSDRYIGRGGVTARATGLRMGLPARSAQFKPTLSPLTSRNTKRRGNTASLFTFVSGNARYLYHGAECYTTASGFATPFSMCGLWLRML